MRTVIITGANLGLGFVAAKKISRNHEYQVILACENKEKAQIARDKIVNETSNKNVKGMILDTFSFNR